MANKINFKKIKIDFIKANYPVLYNTIQSIEGLTDKQQELVAGLCVELTILFDSTPEIFEDEVLDLELDEEDDY